MPAGLLGEQGLRGGCAGACGRQRIHLAARQLLRASLASAAPRSDSSVRSFGPIRRRFYHNARYLSCAGSLQSSGSPASSSVRHAIDTAWRPSAMALDTVGRRFWCSKRLVLRGFVIRTALVDAETYSSARGSFDAISSYVVSFYEKSSFFFQK